MSVSEENALARLRNGEHDEMILNTGSRTDIPAYYSDWFYNRIAAGYVYVRNPYYPSQITKYLLSPEVIDVMVFCTKNPEPMLDRLSLLSGFDTFWFVTITPYGQDIEPHVPPMEQVIHSFKRLSALVTNARMSWRYDPIFITDRYSIDYHIEQFAQMSKSLSGYTSQCVVSFIDLYEKTKRNFHGVRSVTDSEQEILISAFSTIAKENKLQIHLCCENTKLIREMLTRTAVCRRPCWRKLWTVNFVYQRKKPHETNAPACWAQISAHITHADTAVCIVMQITTGKPSKGTCTCIIPRHLS